MLDIHHATKMAGSPSSSITGKYLISKTAGFSTRSMARAGGLSAAASVSSAHGRKGRRRLGGPLVVGLGGGVVGLGQEPDAAGQDGEDGDTTQPCPQAMAQDEGAEQKQRKRPPPYCGGGVGVG